MFPILHHIEIHHLEITSSITCIIITSEMYFVQNPYSHIHFSYTPPNLSTQTTLAGHAFKNANHHASNVNAACMLFTVSACSATSSTFTTITSTLLALTVILKIKNLDSFASSCIKLLQLLASLFKGTPTEHIIEKIAKYISHESNSSISTKPMDASEKITTTIIELLCDSGANFFILNNNKLLHDLTPCYETVGVTGGTHDIVTCKVNL